MPSTPGSVVIRGEAWKMAYAAESSFGVDPGTGNYTNVFGVVQTANMPDPTISFQSFWGMTNASNRNWSITYPGPLQLQGSIPDIVLLDGRPLIYPIGGVINSGAGPTYTHTITESGTLNSIAMHLSQYGSDNNVKLMRRFLGGKINRATISASEGDYLRYSVDEVDFINFTHDQAGYPYYSASVADITPSYPSTSPYYFSMGSLSLDGTVFGRIRNFRLAISNSADAKYYISDVGGNLLPYEYREGQRTYQMTCQIDLEDAALYKELLQMGTYSNVYKGFAVIITFTRAAGTDTITMTMPWNSGTGIPGSGLDNMGCLFQSMPYNVMQDPVVSTQATITGRNLGIVVVDSIAAY